MISKILGLGAMILALGVMFWHPAFNIKTCCPPAAPQDVIQFNKVQSIDAETSAWLEVLTHEQSLIRAYAAGTVKEIVDAGSAGMMVVLEHSNGLFSVYKHLRKIDVEIGDIVSQGQNIGNPKIDLAYLTARFDFSLLFGSKQLGLILRG